LVTVAEMRAADRYTIEELGISGLVLMEEAGRLVTELSLRLLKGQQSKGVVIWAGRGNNGGDGFVVARRLYLAGYQPQVFLVCDDPERVKGDARRNLDILRRLNIAVEHVWSEVEFARAAQAAASAALQVDALVGTGSRGALTGPLAQAVVAMNDAETPIVAVDLPSGLNADTGQVPGKVVRASHTVTIGRAKPGLLTYPGAKYVGRLQVVDIGIPPQAYDGRRPQTFSSDKSDLAAILPRWSPTVHKGQRGRVLVVGGSPGLSGAACLASEAALRAGAGLVTLAVPERLHDLMEIKLTEVMTSPLPETATGCISLEAARLILDHGAEADVLALGPGLGSGPELPAAVARIVGRAEVPLVIDADGLNALVGQLGVLAAKRAPLILTPHPGELARLANTTAAHVQAQRLPLARELAQQWGVVMVLKGARTIIAAPDGTCYINSTGGPALATGGSGDVLTGVIAGLLAQGLEPIQAAVAGVFVHGLAGDMAPGQLGGSRGVVAGDLIDLLPAALAALEQ
jgi:hydroxyethylthiazole kinase-like uncharacterized protein yjeF